jgi:hypothetical protein
MRRDFAAVALFFAIVIIAIVAFLAYDGNGKKAAVTTTHHPTCWTPKYAAAHNPKRLTPAPRHGAGAHGVDKCDPKAA